MNQIACTGCQSPIQIPPELMGQQFRCPVCQLVLSAPAAAAPSASSNQAANPSSLPAPALPPLQSQSPGAGLPAPQVAPSAYTPTNTPVAGGLPAYQSPNQTAASQPVAPSQQGGQPNSLAPLQQPVGYPQVPGFDPSLNPNMGAMQPNTMQANAMQSNVTQPVGMQPQLGGLQPNMMQPAYSPMQQSAAPAQEPLEIVNQGIKLIFFSMLCLILGCVITAVEYGMGGFRFIGSLAGFASTILLIAGLFKCTKVPEKSGARPSANFALWCASFCAVVGLFRFVFAAISEVLAAVLVVGSFLAPFAVILFFMSFIERVGQFTRQQKYVDDIEAIRTAFFIGLFAPVLGVIMVMIIPIRLSFFVIFAGIVAMLYFQIKFIILLSDLKFRRTTTAKPKPGEAWKTSRQ